MARRSIAEARYGAKRQSFEVNSPRAHMQTLLDKHKGDYAAMEADSWAIVSTDPELLRAIHKYWFQNNHRSLVGGATRAVVVDMAEKIVQRKEREVAVAAMVQRAKQKLVANVLDMLVGNKPLGDFTREEGLALGGETTKLFSSLKPGQRLRDGYSNAQIAKLAPSIKKLAGE